MHRIEFTDGIVVVIDNPNFVTEAVVGLCIYGEDKKTNTLYPWHRVKEIHRTNINPIPANEKKEDSR